MKLVVNGPDVVHHGLMYIYDGMFFYLFIASLNKALTSST